MTLLPHGYRWGGAESILSTRVMPTPMPTGGRIQSVTVGVTFPFVFRRRSQTGPVGLRTLSGNAVGGEPRHEGSNPSRSALPLADKAFGRPTSTMSRRSQLPVGIV